MAGSEADRQADEEAESTGRSERPSLADFLKPPPRSKSSMPPAAETASVPDVPPASETPSPRELGGLFAEPPIPRSRRRSSLIPPPSPAVGSAPAAIEETNVEGKAHDDLAGATSDDLAGATSNENEIDDEVSDAEVALSVPPPIFTRGLVRRVAMSAGAILATALLVLGARKLRRAPVASPMAAVSAPAASAEAPGAASPADDLPPEAEEIADDLPIDEAKGLELRHQARAMLESGRIDEGVALARKAVEANPNDPETYILLAAGLQDQNKWDEARQIFGKCVRQSSRAERSECIYFATRGK